MSLVRKQFSIGETSSFECWIYVIRHADGRPDEFWFKGHDVAEFLEYKKPNDAIRYNVHEDWQQKWSALQATKSFGTHVTSPQDDVITPPNWQPHTVFISEPGLYALVTRSKKPEAVRFTKWVYEEVLPSLRRSGTYNATQTEGSTSAHTVSRDALLLLQKDMEIQKLRYDNQLSEKDREIERQRIDRDREIERQQIEKERQQIEKDREIERRESQSRELQAKFENERLTMHYRYAFQTNSARELGRAAIDQHIKLKAVENAHKIIKSEITGKYRLIRNMDDINPLKVNHLSFVLDKRTGEYRVIRQQFGTTLKMYDCIQKTAGADLEQLEPGKHKRRLNTDVFLVGDMITVAHGVNIWTNYLQLRRPCLFGLRFSTATYWNRFTIMDEPALREHYRCVRQLCGDGEPTTASDDGGGGGGGIDRLSAFYKTLYEDLRFDDEDDCVAKCLLTDGVWQLRQHLIDYVETNSYEFIETASVTEQPSITYEQLVNGSMDEFTVNALNDVAQKFPEDLETLRLRTVCERQHIIAPSSTVRNIQQFAIDANPATSTARSVVTELPPFGQPESSSSYTVQVPDTPRRPTDDDDAAMSYTDVMSIASVETSRSSPIIDRYMSDMHNIRQTKVDKYTK